MQERELNITINEDPSIVEIDNKKKLHEILKILKEVSRITGAFREMLESETLEKGLSETMLYLLESYIVDLHKQFNYDSIIKKENEKRYTEIKRVNTENRELRKHLGEKINPEDFREGLKNFENIIRDWWRKEGLGHISEVTFCPYSCKVEFNGSLFCGLGDIDVENLIKKGYDLIKEGYHDYNLNFTDKNIRFIINEVKKRFPSAELEEVKISNYKGLFIKDIIFHIINYYDIVLNSHNTDMDKSTNKHTTKEQNNLSIQSVVTTIEKKQLIKGIKARSNLYILGFVSESENNKIQTRLEKFQKKHRINVSREELSSQ